MSKAFNEFHEEIMEKIIEPKFQMLAATRTFATSKDFFDMFRETFKCSISDNMLRRWLKELQYELVVRTSMVPNLEYTAPPQTEQMVQDEDGFDNETQKDWVKAGGFNGTGISGG
tara:strand:+ start:27 stop:371 length:345 start_codon:yes stop_codon:yes gene_type:complete